jgi:hypothetical protein
MTKLKISLFFKKYRKKFETIHKGLINFCPKTCHLAPKNMGLVSDIRDVEKPIPDPRYRIPDPGAKKALDPGSGSATLYQGRIVIDIKLNTGH